MRSNHAGFNVCTFRRTSLEKSVEEFRGEPSHWAADTAAATIRRDFCSVIQRARMRVELPLDHLSELWPNKFRGSRIGALVHPASVSSTLEHASRILERHNGDLFRLAAFFGPQHGFLGQTQDNMVEWKSYEHSRLHIPVYSLYGDHREPTEKCWKAWMFCWSIFKTSDRVTTLLFGRYTSASAPARDAASQSLCLDRPNPIDGVTTEGPVLDPNYESFVGMHPLPVRHGRTIGELAGQFRDEVFPECELHVLPMKNWERAMWFDQTGLPWVMPSPNMPTLNSATVYPGMCLFEGTNISEGRGTTRPFEIFGAPFIDAEKLCTSLSTLEASRRFLPRKLFSANLPKICRSTVRRRTNSCDRSRTIPAVSSRGGNYQVSPQNLP